MNFAFIYNLHALKGAFFCIIYHQVMQNLSFLFLFAITWWSCCYLDNWVIEEGTCLLLTQKWSFYRLLNIMVNQKYVEKERGIQTVVSRIWVDKCMREWKIWTRDEGICVDASEGFTLRQDNRHSFLPNIKYIQIKIQMKDIIEVNVNLVWFAHRTP